MPLTTEPKVRIRVLWIWNGGGKSNFSLISKLLSSESESKIQIAMIVASA